MGYGYGLLGAALYQAFAQRIWLICAHFVLLGLSAGYYMLEMYLLLK